MAGGMARGGGGAAREAAGGHGAECDRGDGGVSDDSEWEGRAKDVAKGGDEGRARREGRAADGGGRTVGGDLGGGVEARRSGSGGELFRSRGAFAVGDAGGVAAAAGAGSRARGASVV